MFPKKTNVVQLCKSLFLFVHLLHLYRIVYYRSEAVLFCDNYNLRKVKQAMHCSKHEEESQRSCVKGSFCDVSRTLSDVCFCHVYFYSFFFFLFLHKLETCNPPTFHSCSSLSRSLHSSKQNLAMSNLLLQVPYKVGIE